MTRISDSERRRLFGQPGKVPTKTVRTPWGIATVVHALVAEVFLDACHQAAAEVTWKPRRIDSYVVRAVRGSSSSSLHSYALAWDFFVTAPGVTPPGGVWTPDDGVPPEFAHCFTERGFTWGDTWQRKDTPHIEWAGAPPTGKPWRGSGHTEDIRHREDDDMATAVRAEDVGTSYALDGETFNGRQVWIIAGGERWPWRGTDADLAEAVEVGLVVGGDKHTRLSTIGNFPRRKT